MIMKNLRSMPFNMTKLKSEIKKAGLIKDRRNLQMFASAPW
jgi:hypothetical protein